MAEIIAQKMATPHRIFIKMTNSDVSSIIDAFWKENGERMMKSMDGSFTKVANARPVAEQKMGALNLYKEGILSFIEKMASSGTTQYIDLSDVTVNDFEYDTPCVASMVAYLMPSVRLGDYKNMSVTLNKPTVSEEDIKGYCDMEIAKSDLVQTISVDRDRVRRGDMIKVNYIGTPPEDIEMDISEFTAEDQIINLNDTNSFMPTFLAAMVGLKKDTPSDINVAFPDDYMKQDLAGKTVKFNITVKDIIDHKMPSEEEHAKHMGHESVDKWKDTVRENILKNKMENFETTKEDLIFVKIEEALIKDCEFDPLPDGLVERQLNGLIEMISASRGISSADMASAVNRDGMRPLAIRRIVARLCLEAVADLEDFKYTETLGDEYIEHVKKIKGEEAAKAMKERSPEEVENMAKVYWVTKMLKEDIIVNEI